MTEEVKFRAEGAVANRKRCEPRPFCGAIMACVASGKKGSSKRK